MNEIQDLDELITKLIPKDAHILAKTLTNAINIASNYWSNIYQLDIDYATKETDVKSTKHFVVKCVVPDSAKAVMNKPMFKSEIQFYREVLPTLQQFLRNNNLPEMNFFPNMRAARINTEEVDENSVIILEDLRYEGYQNMDKLKGINLEETKSLLIDIATFHAVPLAIKHSNSVLFQTKIKNNCIDPLPLPKPTNGENNTPPPFPFELLREVLEESEFCKANLDKFEQIVKKTKEETQPIVFFKRKDPNGKFSTLCHNDMWINNIMQTTEEPKKNKLLDFQIYTIDNLALDLIYFLFTSVNSEVLQRNFDYLLRFYYDSFIQILKLLKCTENYFQYDYFIEKVNEAAVDKFIHIGSMTMIATKSKKNGNGDVHTGAKEKFVFLFTEMVKRKWI